MIIVIDDQVQHIEPALPSPAQDPPAARLLLQPPESIILLQFKLLLLYNYATIQILIMTAHRRRRRCRCLATLVPKMSIFGPFLVPGHFWSIFRTVSPRG